MSDYLTMIPQQCQEKLCNAVYRCKFKLDDYQFEAQCKKCNFDSGCKVKEKIDVLAPEFGLCPTCYQQIIEAN